MTEQRVGRRKIARKQRGTLKDQTVLPTRETRDSDLIEQLSSSARLLTQSPGNLPPELRFAAGLSVC